MKSNDSNSWTVSDAKAKLSEVLRRARTEGPQRIGQHNPCLVVSQADWNRVAEPKTRLGNWLVENLAQHGELDLPSSDDPPRTAPFADEE